MGLWSPAPSAAANARPDWARSCLFVRVREKTGSRHNVTPRPGWGLLYLIASVGSESDGSRGLMTTGKRARWRRVAAGQMGPGGGGLWSALRVVIDRRRRVVASPVCASTLVGLGIVTQRFAATPTYMMFYGGVP